MAQKLVQPGRLEVISGCMFSGKTRILIRRASEAARSGLRVVAFKHASDDRYDRFAIVSHDGERLAARPVLSSQDLWDAAAPADVVAIDEAQFFDAGLPDVCRRLAGAGKRIIVAGLNRDSWGRPFGPVPRLETLADDLTRTTAACAVCGRRAEYTQRLTPIGESMIGGRGDYEPRCERCFAAPLETPR